MIGHSGVARDKLGENLAAVGLPLRPIEAYLESRGLALPANVERLYCEKPFLNWQSF